MKILCALGKYQYGDPARGLSTEYAAFLPALKNLGHAVVHFELWNRRAYPSYAHMNRLLCDAVDREHPDVLLTVQLQYEIFIETLDALRQRGEVATVCWTTDDSWKYRQVSRFIGRHYHAMTTTYPDLIPAYHRDGILHVLPTQWAARSDRLNPPLPFGRCRYPVSFVGEAHGNRKLRMKWLQDQGIAVACFGYGWPHGPVSADDVTGIMRDSVISLNFANARDQRNQMKARTFEVPGAGGCLLTETAPDLDNWYVPDQEIAVFKNDQELVEKIRFFLANPDIRDRIAMAGFQRTAADHTYEKRLASVLDLALSAKNAQRKNGCVHTAAPVSSRVQGNVPPTPIRKDRPLLMLRNVLIWICRRIWGNTRGPRAARRIVFEMSWRLAGEKTFSASGWPARMFPEL